MSIYGFGNGELGSETSSLTCINCGQQGFVKFTVLGKYFHFIFIPVFPTGRKGQSVCANCRQTIDEVQLNHAYKQEYYRISGKIKTPKRHFAWLFLFAIITPFVAWHQSCNKKEDAGFISAPKPGDLYEIKLGWRSYTLYKVVYANKDSVYFFASKYEVNKQRKLSEDKMLKAESFDSEQTIAFSRGQLKKLQDEEKIVDIVRD